MHTAGGRHRELRGMASRAPPSGCPPARLAHPCPHIPLAPKLRKQYRPARLWLTAPVSARPPPPAAGELAPLPRGRLLVHRGAAGGGRGLPGADRGQGAEEVGAAVVKHAARHWQPRQVSAEHQDLVHHRHIVTRQVAQSTHFTERCLRYDLEVLSSSSCRSAPISAWGT